METVCEWKNLNDNYLVTVEGHGNENLCQSPATIGVGRMEDYVFINLFIFLSFYTNLIVHSVLVALGLLNHPLH